MKARKPELREGVDAAELGAMMREVRENLGHDLKDVAEDLRIRLVYLEAIEAGRLSALPGSAYVSGFIRSYSEFLGLDGEEIVRRFRMAGIQISGQTPLHLPSPVEEGRLPTGAIFLAAALVAAVAYGGWYYLSSDGRDPAGLVDRVPADLSGIAGGAGQAPETSSTGQAPETNGAGQTPGTSGAGAVVPPATVPAPATAPPPETAAEQQTPPSSVPTSPAPSPTAASPEPADPAPAAPEPAPESPRTPPSAAQATAIPDAPATVAATEPPAAPSAVAPDAQARETPSPAQETAPEASPDALPAGAATEPAAPAVAAGGVAGAGAGAGAGADGSDPDVTPPPTQVAPETASAEVGVSGPDGGAASPVPSSAVPPAPPAAPPAALPAALPPALPPAISPTAALTELPAAPGATAAAATPSRVASQGRRIVIRALAESYVAVLTRDNQTLFSQLMKPGDSYEVPSGANLVLQTGNAGGLQLTVDGRRVPALGQVGDVRDDVQLDADILLGTPR